MGSLSHCVDEQMSVISSKVRCLLRPARKAEYNCLSQGHAADKSTAPSFGSRDLSLIAIWMEVWLLSIATPPEMLPDTGAATLLCFQQVNGNLSQGLEITVSVVNSQPCFSIHQMLPTYIERRFYNPAMLSAQVLASSVRPTRSFRFFSKMSI